MWVLLTASILPCSSWLIVDFAEESVDDGLGVPFLDHVLEDGSDVSGSIQL